MPLLELYILIQVGGWLGALPTIAACVFTAVLGALLLKQQGLKTITRVQARLNHGELPATEMIEGVILLSCGVFLLTPGFFTDSIGFACLVPPFRRWLATGLLKHAFMQMTANASVNGNVTVEGEYWEEQDKRLK